jgi:predicted PurR-regulated permease PerM
MPIEAMETDQPSPQPGQAQPLDVVAPIDVRNASLVVLATIAVIFVLHWSQIVLIPIALAIFMRYALMPVVAWLDRRARIPAVLGAALVLALIVSGTAIGVASLQDEALDMLDKLPRAAQKLALAVREKTHDRTATIAKLKTAATEIDRAAAAASAPEPQSGQKAAPAPKTQPTPVPQVSAIIWSGSVGVLVGLGQAMVVVALAYFLLISGDTFKRKLVRISGNTLTKKKITVQILQEIDQQLQRYLVVQVAAAILQGTLTWLALALIGLDNAVFWGLVAGVLHLIPYVGPTTVIVMTGIVAYLQFEDVTRVCWVVGGQLVITGLVGFGVMPALTARLGKLSAVTVFVALLFWGWLWGVWGLLLGVPIVMAVQAVCERVPELNALGELLGSEAPKVNAAEGVRAQPGASETTAS